MEATAAEEAGAIVRRGRGAATEESVSVVAEEAEVVSAAAEEPEATAAEETNAASVAADQEEALAAKVPQWRIRSFLGYGRSMDEELEATEAHKNRSQNQNNWTRSWKL